MAEYSTIEMPKSAPIDSTMKQQIDRAFTFQCQDISSNVTDDSSSNSILEKCIRQYEIFCEVYLSHVVLQLPYSDTEEQHDVFYQDYYQIDREDDENRSNDCSKVMHDSLNVPDPARSEMLYMPKCTARLQGIDKLFDTLKIRVENRTKNLQHLLNRSLMTDCVGDTAQLDDDQSCLSHAADAATRMNLQALLNLRLNSSQRMAIKLAINLLVEMSTFPHCTKNIAVDKNGKVERIGRENIHCHSYSFHSIAEKELPSWLKVLCLIAAYSHSDRELQVAAITTLFDLIR